MSVSRAGAVGLIAAGLTAGAARPAAAQALVPVRIGTSLSDPFLQPYYAQAEGLFANAGLTSVTIQALNNGSTVMSAVLGGALDVGVTDLIGLANAHNRGADVAIFASGALYNSTLPTISLCVKKDSPYQTAKDLEGQVIAVPNLKSTGGIAISEWLVHGGADLSKVKFYEMLFPEMGPALMAGRIAAALNGEPFLTDAKDEIRRIANPYDYVAKSFYTGVWNAKRSWLDANVATGKALAAALYATARWANTHQAASAVIEARVTQVDLQKLKTFVRNGFATSFDAKYAQPLLDLAYKYKVIEQPTSVTDLLWSPA